MLKFMWKHIKAVKSLFRWDLLSQEDHSTKYFWEFRLANVRRKCEKHIVVGFIWHVTTQPRWKLNKHREKKSSFYISKFFFKKNA